MVSEFHSCAKCSNGFTNVVCVSKYRHSVFATLGLPVIKCRLPASCGVHCGMPAAFELVDGHPKLTMDGYCGEKHMGYVASGAWRSAQLRSLNAELDGLVTRETILRKQISELERVAKGVLPPAYVPKKLVQLKVETYDVVEKIREKNDDLVVVMDFVAAELSPDSSPKRLTCM